MAHCGPRARRRPRTVTAACQPEAASAGPVTGRPGGVAAASGPAGPGPGLTTGLDAGGCSASRVLPASASPSPSPATRRSLESHCGGRPGRGPLARRYTSLPRLAQPLTWQVTMARLRLTRTRRGLGGYHGHGPSPTGRLARCHGDRRCNLLDSVHSMIIGFNG
jgi:hypothetical protein